MRLLLPAFSPRLAFSAWRREATIYRRIWPSTIASNLMDPVIYLLALGFGLGAFLTEVDGMPYARFIAPGLIGSAVMMAAMYEVAWNSFIRIHTEHVYEAMIATPATVEDVVAGELAWAATRATIYACVMLVVLAVFPGIGVSPWGILVIPCAFLGGLAFAVVGLSYTAIIRHIDQETFLFTLFVTPMFLFSGIFFPLTRVPEGVVWVAQALPLYHLVEVSRGLVHGVVGLHLLPHLAYLVGVPLALYGVTMRLVRRRLVA